MANASEQQQLEGFESLLEEVRRQLTYAQIHFSIWEQLWPTEENVDIINAYRGFFLPTRDANLDLFFITISNVVSNDPRAPSLYRLLSMIDNYPGLAPNIIDIQLLRNRLKAQKNLLKRIKGFRNKRAAHWGTEVSEQIGPVRFGESREVLKELQNIFNEISYAHGNQTWIFKPTEHRDASRVIDNLRRIFGKPKL